MNISILCFNLSSNCLGRAHVLAQLLERNHNIEMVGPELNDGVWSPLQDEYDYTKLKTNGMIYEFPNIARDLMDEITGDVVYASKPRMTSYGVGLLRTVGRDVPLILDIDDWDLGFAYAKNPPLLAHLRATGATLSVNSTNYTWLLERFISLADDRTVSNQYLKNKFGGTIIPHARDTNQFNPSKFDDKEIRKELGLSQDRTLVMFSGTPRPHKGVDDLVKAIQDLDRAGVMGVIVGAGDSKYAQTLREVSDSKVIIRGQQPFDQLPKWIAAADIIAIPQRRTPATRGQIPAKVFDAMAMAKPIIATDVSDLPEILDGCGMIVPPDSPRELANSLKYLLDNPTERAALGRKARERCIEEYSYDAVAPTLDRIVKGVV